jgi:metal-responsive CopG/Arc/MetJ family transcriptional regulator
MEKLKKHLCIRLTGDQFRKLADALIDEEQSKSELLRNLINNYLERHSHKTVGKELK